MPKKFLAPVLFFVLMALSGGALAALNISAQSQAYTQKELDLANVSSEYNATQTQGEFYGQQVVSSDLPSSPTDRKVLGETDKPKRIEVDLTTQHLYAFEGDEKVYDFLISSGKWGRTPTGTFHIWGKFRFAKMEGGSKELHTYYYLPNVPYVMFFSNDEVAASKGFSLHGTYWHKNFGEPMSHGCINMKTEEAGILYEWTHPTLGDKKSGRATTEDPGTEITIYGKYEAK